MQQIINEIRVLMVEDSSTDAKLILYALKRYGLSVQYERVQDAACMRQALLEKNWDAVLSDYTMPQFSGDAALEVLKQTGLDIPFILVSGQVGEETAVSLMKAGASDFVMKDNLGRLPTAIERELREAHVRRQRLRAEAELASQRILMETILHQAAEAILVCDRQGQILFANPAALHLAQQPDLVSLQRESAWGRETLLDGEEIPRDQWAIPRALRGEVMTGREVHMIRQDGSSYDVLINGSPLEDGDGNIIGAVSVLTDITVLHRAEEKLRKYTAELERSNRELKEFASIASHDLQEPLRKVKVLGEMLQKAYQEALDSDGREYITRMINASNRMEEMITGLLAYARISARDNPFSPVDLAKAAQEVLSDLEILVEQTRGRVEVEDLPTIEANPLQMRQLLQNLIGNALKFHLPDAAPVVKVWAEPVSPNDGQKPMICLYVRDNGIGFDEKDLGRLFQPFCRLHGRSEFKGSGMGLAICHKIVDRHNGTITAASQQGQGSTFIVTLPTRQPFSAEREEG